MACGGIGDTINWVFSFWTVLQDRGWKKAHEEGKLEFRDAEDDAPPVWPGRGEACRSAKVEGNGRWKKDRMEEQGGE